MKVDAGTADFLQSQAKVNWGRAFKADFMQDESMPPGMFLHVQKCGGTAIRSLLYAIGLHHNVASVVGDTTLCQPKEFAHRCDAFKAAQPKFYAKAFKFCFVRNVWDRCVSAWLYFEQRRGIVRPFQEFLELGLIDRRRGQKGGRFRGLAVAGKKRASVSRRTLTNHLMPFTDPAYHIGDMDFVGRVENFEHDLRYALQNVGLGDYDGPMPRRNWTDRPRPYTDYFNKQTRDMVARFYAKDIKTFGFEFGC